MSLYTVVLQPHGETEVFVNYFWADNMEHAREQAEEAEPYSSVLGIFVIPYEVVFPNG